MKFNLPRPFAATLSLLPFLVPLSLLPALLLLLDACVYPQGADPAMAAGCTVHGNRPAYA